MMHPRDMEVSALAYHIRLGLDDAFVIDFLSDRAQNSLVNFLAIELKKFYETLRDRENKMDYAEYDSMIPFFEKATKRHPLYAVFGDVLANAVDTACDPVFAELERRAKVDASR